MGGDLVARGAQVHEAAREVLDFWFALPSEKQFAVDPALDRAIATRFAGVHGHLAASVEGWTDAPETLLAAIVVLDQFSRNLFRDSPQAFVQDAAAVDLTRHAIRAGWEEAFPPERRVFLYLPLMHAERLDLQDLSVAKYEALGVASNIDYTRKHRASIAPSSPASAAIRHAMPHSAAPLPPKSRRSSTRAAAGSE